jgi:hypothetical protein
VNTPTLTWASLDDLEPELVSRGALKASEALQYASFVLWSLSGRLYTPIRTTIEAYDTRSTLSSGAQVYPAMLNGKMYNISSCSKCQCQGCGVFHRTRLRGYPVRSIVDVWINGCRLPRDDYVLLDKSVLGLMNPESCGATCIVVEYQFGTGVPAGGKNAVARLAEELLRSSQGTECALPERVTSISRQGMSWTLLDPQDFLDDGRTGIYEIDLLLRALNPTRALARPRVFSPDLERATVYEYGDPPLSLMLQPDDQVVQTGTPARWVSSDPKLVKAVRDNQFLVTNLPDGTIINGHWREMAPGAGGVVLDIEPHEVTLMKDGMGFTVTEYPADVVVHRGTIRILE